ncbi:MAG TPA: hypothetical protein VNG33_10555 [Polyangiaceae bacterium]|nr:hypothetical protein [Polyangiaceae bacterium]
MKEDLSCAQCGAGLPWPSDPTILTIRCGYCGHQMPAPDFAKREELLLVRERQGLAQIDVQIKSQDNERERRGQIGCLILAGVGLAALAFIVYTNQQRGERERERWSHPDLPPIVLPDDLLPVPSASRTLTGLVGEGEASGCQRRVVAPVRVDASYTSSLTLPHAACVRFLATSEDTSAELALTLKTENGAQALGDSGLGVLNRDYCAKQQGKYALELSASGKPFWLSVLACQRSFPSDPKSAGVERLDALLAQRRAHGCSVSLEPFSAHEGQHFSLALFKGQCVQILAATGIDDNALSLTFKDPIGGDVASLPAAATELSFSYCATRSGAHLAVIDPALDGPFTFASVACPRSALTAP